MGLLAIGATALVLFIDYIIRPNVSIVASWLQKKRYNADKQASLVQKEIWKDTKKKEKNHHYNRKYKK